jgi:hypothetical protein
VVVLDSYERIASIGALLRRTLLPALPQDTAVVIASRERPEPGWLEGGWGELTRELEIGALGDEEALELLGAAGLVAQDTAREVVSWAGGSPLALTLGARAAAADPDWEPARGLERPEVIEPLVARIAEPDIAGEHLATLGTAALARTTTRTLLAEVLPERDAEAEYKWLVSRSFTEPLGDGVAPHELVRGPILSDLHRRDPLLERELRLRIADHLYGRAAAGGGLLMAIDLAHLAQNPALRWGFSWEAASRLRVDDPMPGDAEIVAAKISRPAEKATWEMGQRYFAEAPEHVVVCRDQADQLCGYFTVLTPGGAPEWSRDDPLAGPWLEHARTLDPPGEALIYRDSIELTGNPLSGVIGLLGMAGLLRAARGNPRYAYLAIDPEYPGATVFAEAAGGAHLSELDVELAGVRHWCYLIDWGPGGLFAAQRETIYRELGLDPPPRPRDNNAISVEVVRRALRDLQLPHALARSPLARGGSVAERAAHVRSVLTDAAREAFGDAGPDDLLRATIVRGYLEPASSHEAAAAELHLSRASYFRKLRQACERLADHLSAGLSPTATPPVPSPRTRVRALRDHGL